MLSPDAELGALLKLLPEGVSVTAVIISLVFGTRYVKFLHHAHEQDKDALAIAYQEQMRVVMEACKEERILFRDTLAQYVDANKELAAQHARLVIEQTKVAAGLDATIRRLGDVVWEIHSRVTRRKDGGRNPFEEAANE